VKHYTEEEIERGLQALVLSSGNHRRASELLRDAGYTAIPSGTVREWRRRTHMTRYAELQEQLRPELNARIAEDHDRQVQAYTALQEEALEKAREGLPEAKAGEAANVFKSAAIAAGINTEKTQLRRGEPTEIRDTAVGIEDIIERLRHPKFAGVLRATVLPAIESTATERDDEAR